MSIINEALKKTEEHLSMNTAKQNQLPVKKINPKIFFIYIFILLAGVFLSNLIFSFLNSKVKTSLSENKITLPVQKPATAVPAPIAQADNTAETKKPEQVNFVLNGIFYSDNDGYALVNNQIVRELDSVDGAKVNKITENSVQLDNQGNIITLVTQR